jgi:hypothetical protein
MMLDDLVAGQDVRDALAWYRLVHVVDRCRNRLERLDLFPGPP